MPGDSIVINQFERAMSDDINNLQRLGTRQVAELLRWLGHQHRVPAGGPTGYGSSYPQGAPTTWALGLVCTAPGGAFYSVSAGMLLSSAPANLSGGWDSDLDSFSVVGLQRTSAVRPMPVANPTRTGGEFYLISARVVTEVTLNTVVEIFDVPTQAFIPQAKDKRVEYRLEYREDAGPQIPSLPALGAFPVLDAFPANQGWEPIAVIRVFPDTGVDDHGQIFDVRNDLLDFIRSAPWDPVASYVAQWFPAEVQMRRLESVAHPSNDNISQGIRGFFRGTIQGKEYSYALPFGQVSTWLFRNDLDTFVDGSMTHFYLVPYKTGSQMRAVTYTGRDASGNRSFFRGFLVACQAACPPTRDGKNSAAIRLPRTGAVGYFTALPDIGAGEAVLVCSAQAKVDAQLSCRPFVMSGGRLVYSLNSNLDAGGPRVVNATLAEGSTVHALTLGPVVPPNARWVELGVRIANGVGSAGPARCDVKVAKEDAKVGGTAALAAALVLDSESVDCGHANAEWWGKLRVPLHTPNPGDGAGFGTLGYFDLAVEFNYQVLSGGTFGSATGSVYVIGWDLGQ